LTVLLDFAGPLGPLRSFDERIEQKQRWMSEVDDSAFDLLLDILVDPPGESEMRQVDPEDYEFELSELLTGVGRRDPAGALAKVGPLAADRRIRPVVIDVIGGLGAPAGVDWLEGLLRSEALSQDELVRVASALGELGGGRARALLEGMRRRYADATPEVQKEIEVALRSVESAQPRGRDLPE
jgi:hypothetical protein